MKKWIRRSFTARIFLTVLLVALLPLILCDVVMMPLLIGRSNYSLQARAEAQLESCRQRLNQVFAGYGEIGGALAAGPAVEKGLSGAGGEREVYQAFFLATKGMYEYASFGLYDENGACRYLVNGSSLESRLDTDWGILRAAAESDKMAFASGGGQALVAAQAIPKAGGGRAGYLALAMTSEHFNALFAGLYDPASSIMLMDRAWRLIYSSQPSRESAAKALRQEVLEGRELTGEGGEFYFYPAREELSGLYLVIQQPKVFTSGVMGTFYAVSGIVGGLSLAFCLGGAWILSRHLSQPVRDLSQAMGRVEKGDFNVRLSTVREDELGRLSNSFNRMVEEYQMNLRRSVARQKELNDTQLRMMQAQLNPHFLYNTLDSMKWLGVAHQVPKVSALAEDLAVLLRASISEDEFVPLEKELEWIERYIDIQSIRFEDRFTCEIDVQEEFQCCMVPKLILQPLVENAILHGVAGREDGYVKILAERRPEGFSITVSDNGCGMPAELVAELNRGERRIPRGHLGLYNVDSILRLNYGQAYGVCAWSEEGAGSRVSVHLPYIRKE